MKVREFAMQVIRSENVRTRAADVLIADMALWTFASLINMSVKEPAFDDSNAALAMTIFVSACSQPGPSGIVLANTTTWALDRIAKNNTEPHKILLLGTGIWGTIRMLSKALRWTSSA